MSNISQKTETKKDIKGKKILYVVTQSKWGGAQKYVLDLAKYFAQDNEVHIAYGEEKNKDQKFLDACQKAKLKIIPVPYLVRHIDLGKDYLAMMEMVKIFNEGKYDLVHLNSSKVGLLGALASRMYAANLMNTKLRLVYTAHGFVFNEAISKFRKKIYKFCERMSTSIQHIVITVSDFDRQSAIDQEVVYDKKMFTIHNGIDLELEQSFYDKNASLKKLNLDKNKKYFVTIANFYKTKGHIYLLEAVKMLKEEKSTLLDDYKFVLIGSGPEMDNIKDKIKADGLEKYFVLLGNINHASRYLKAFEAFVLPSVKEGLPYTLLEAGLAKTPIIASKVGGIGEIIQDKKSGLLINPANPLSLKDAINSISDYNQLVENNYQNIKQNFDLKNTLEKTKEIYQKLF